MTKETSKSMVRRMYDIRFATRYFVGRGIDIGAGNDGLSNFKDFFPGIQEVRDWDWHDGDAQLMQGIEDNTYDFVHSSHCLEHLLNPYEGLSNWIRICRPGGHLVILVPDEDLYEQGQFPSTFNGDHKCTFTIFKKESWSPVSVNLMNLLASFGDQIKTLKIELLDATYRYRAPRYDQTYDDIADSAVEIILKKL
jgi:SAM-dependent methyltransferase